MMREVLIESRVETTVVGTRSVFNCVFVTGIAEIVDVRSMNEVRTVVEADRVVV
jgi:hypothetical protein